MPKTRTLLALVLLPLLVFLVACSGDDDDGDGDNGSTSQPTASDASGSTGTTPASTSPSGDASSSSSGGTDASTILGNCPGLVSMFGLFSAGAFTNPAGNAGDGINSAAQIFQNAADNAPSEIQADMQVLADAFTGLNNALEDLGVDLSNPASFATLNAGQLAQLETVFSSLDTPEVEQASDNLDAWFTENCE